MSKKTACTGRLLWTRLESDYSPENKNGPERTAKIKHAIDEGDRLSDRQTDNKVIRLPRRVAQ